MATQSLFPKKGFYRNPKLTLREYVVDFCKRKKALSAAHRDHHVHFVAQYLDDWGMLDVKMREIDRHFCLNLTSKMMTTTLHPNTQHLYMQALRTLFNDAIRNGVLTVNPILSLDPSERPRRIPTTRNYLTRQEVSRLIKTSCPSIELKQAFLFSCFSGLRISDIRRLKWTHIYNRSGRKEIRLVMAKTKREVIVTLSKMALKYLPKQNGSKWVFPELPRYTGPLLKEWGTAAHISKHFTYHSSRHTFATLLIEYGADIYTVSQLMGHTNIKTTEIYARLVDRRRRLTVAIFDRVFKMDDSLVEAAPTEPIAVQCAHQEST